MKVSAVSVIGCVTVHMNVFVIAALFFKGRLWPVWCCSLLTCLHTAGFGTKVGEINIGLPPVDDGVGVFTGTFRCPPVGHGHLE